MWPFKNSNTPSPNPILEHSCNIFRKACEGLDAVRKVSEDKSVDQIKYGLSQDEWIHVLYEFQNLYLHLTDRFVYGHLSEVRRLELMTELERLSIDTSTDVLFKGWPPDKIEKIRKDEWQNCQTSLVEYAQFKKLFPERGGPTKDTLFWEFGKRIAELSGYGIDISYIMLAEQLAVDALKELEMNRFVEKVTHDNPTASKK